MVTSTNVKNNLSVVADKAATDPKVAAESSTAPEPTEFVDLDAPELYLNRELTWLEFNRRVLHEAQDETNPLLERLKCFS
jgi:polyphosphate kinase